MEKSVNASFIQRFLAFMIDTFLVSFIVSLIAFPFMDNDSLENLALESSRVIEDFSENKIDAKTYVTESIDIVFNVVKQQGVSSLISLFITVVYFVIFQFKKGGQTIGKKLMKIKVVSANGEELTFNNYIFRTMIINSLFINMVLFALMMIDNSKVYFIGTLICNFVNFIVMVCNAIMVISTKSGRGLHDLAANTKVVRCC